MKSLLPYLILVTVSASAVGEDQSPPEVLHSRAVEQGGRTIRYNIVEPPVLPTRPAAGETAVIVTPLTQAELQALEEAAAKPVRALIVEVVAYENGVSELRWQEGGGEGSQACRAFSNADFAALPSLTVLEGQDAVYQFTFLVGKQAGNAPVSVQFQADLAQYIVTGAAPPETALEAFDALHIYYDTAKSELLAAKAAREAAQAQEAAGPPAPKDVTVNFWINSDQTSPQ